MTEEKEFGKKEYILELKIVQCVSVDTPEELKEKLIERITERAFSYSFKYLTNDIEKNGFSKIGNINDCGYYKGKLTKYEGISEEDKLRMNTEIEGVRASFMGGFTKEQKDFMDSVHLPLHKTIEDLFNNSEIFKELIEDSMIDYQEKKENYDD